MKIGQHLEHTVHALYLFENGSWVQEPRDKKEREKLIFVDTTEEARMG